MNFVNEKLSFKKILPFLIGFGVIIVLLVVGYFVDYKLTSSLSNLQDGKYFSSNVYGRIFELVGEDPLYLVSAISIGLAMNGTKFLNKKGLSKFLYCLGIVLIFGLYVYMTKRIFKMGNQLLDSVDWYESHDLVIYLVGAAVGLILTPLTVFLTSKVKEEYKLNLALFGLMVVCSALLSQGITQLIKPFVGRLRYRAIYVLEYNHLDEYAVFSRFLQFKGKGTLTAEMEALGLTKDIFKSFPSGHTTAGAMIFGLGFIVPFLNLDEKKKVKWNIILWSIAICYVIILGIARMVMGAHYLTDVAFGALITLSSLVVSFVILRSILKKNQKVTKQ